MGAALGARPVDPAHPLVDAVHSAHFPLAAGDLPHEGAVGPVVVEVLPPGALAQPQEGAVREPARGAVDVDPRLRRLAQQRRRSARLRVGDVEVEPRLLAVLDLVHDAPAVRRPADADDQRLAPVVGVQVDPGGVAAAGVRDAETHHGVGIAGLGVGPLLDLGVVLDVVHDRECRHRGAVEPQERDARRVGAPPVAAEVAAPVDLLLVQPSRARRCAPRRSRRP